MDDTKIIVTLRDIDGGEGYESEVSSDEGGASMEHAVAASIALIDVVCDDGELGVDGKTLAEAIELAETGDLGNFVDFRNGNLC